MFDDVKLDRYPTELPGRGRPRDRRFLAFSSIRRADDLRVGFDAFWELDLFAASAPSRARVATRRFAADADDVG